MFTQKFSASTCADQSAKCLVNFCIFFHIKAPVSLSFCEWVNGWIHRLRLTLYLRDKPQQDVTWERCVLPDSRCAFVSLLWLGQQSPTDIRLTSLCTDRNLIPFRALQYISQTLFVSQQALRLHDDSYMMVCESMFSLYKVTIKYYGQVFCFQSVDVV